MTRILKFIAISVLFLASVKVHAILIFTDQAEWEAAVSGSVEVESFGTIVPETLLGTISFDDFQSVAASGAYFHEVRAGGRYTAAIMGSAVDKLQWEFNSGINAFGGNFFSINNTGLTVSGDFDGAGVQTINVYDYVISNVSTGNGWFGIIGTNEFSTISWNTDDGSEWFQVSDLRYTAGSTAQVPEPSTLAIFALGIIGLASRRFKKQ